MILYIPLGIILYKIDWIMGESLFNADSGSLDYATQYTRTIMVGFFFEALYDLEKKYLLQFGNAIFPMLIQFFTLPLHVVTVSSMSSLSGLYGLAMATNISFMLNFVVLHIYLTLVTKEPYRFALFYKGAKKE